MTTRDVRPRALIAEDEPLLAAVLVKELRKLWPALDVIASVGDGASAVERALSEHPDLIWLDVRMPVLDGLDAAEAIMEDWPGDAGPLPLIVFVTAHEEHALEAFDRAATDYLLKPVRPERLAKSVERLQRLLDERGATQPAADLARTLEATRSPNSGQAPLQVIQAARGSAIAVIPIDEVLYFEATDKYVRVVTAVEDHWIRTPLKELMDRLPEGAFWQVHRSALVRASAISEVQRDAQGRFSLAVRGRPERLAVSRLHAYRFRAM